MTAIVNRILAADPAIQRAVSAYIDDLFVAEDLISANQVRDHLSAWGLEAKAPEWLGLAEGVRVLGLRVDSLLQWRRDGALPAASQPLLTRRQMHSFLGEWVSHFPVAGWLRVACALLQRATADDGVNWDAPVSEDTMVQFREAEALLNAQGDPAKGQWLVAAHAPMNVWVDASSIAVGVVLEVDGSVVEDASWLRPKADSAHINRCELDAAIRGINLALLWGRRKLTLITDSATVHGWLQAVVNKTHNVKTRALGEVLIRRRLDTLRDVIAEEQLDIDVRLVRSADNLADRLTRVPKSWWQKRWLAVPAITVTTAPVPTLQDIRAIHDRCHFGVDRTLALAREHFGDGVSRRMVRRVVLRCDQCAKIDPAVTFNWDHGSLAASDVWERWAVDITQVRGRPFLSIIDTASAFTMWRALRNELAHEIDEHLHQLFAMFGPLESLLADNGMVFRSQELAQLLREWEVALLLSCAYRHQGNGIVERVHRTVKRTVERTRGSVDEAVFWLNNTCGERAASPFELVFGARCRKPGVSTRRVVVERPPSPLAPLDSSASTHYQDCTRNPFSIGDQVYLRLPDGRCDREWSGPHRVTAVGSSVSVTLDDDGVSRHVSHLRRVPRSSSCGSDAAGSEGTSDSDCDRAGPIAMDPYF